MADTFTVKAENYVSNFSFLSSTLRHFDRIHRIEQNMREVDVIPKVWILAIGDIKPQQVSVPGLDGDIPIEGPSAVFIPPFCPVQWKIAPSIIEFSSFSSVLELPSDMPRQPILFKWNNSQMPKTEQEIFQILRKAKEVKYIHLPGRYSKTAEQTKKFLDDNYHKRFSIADVAKQLKLSHSFLTRSFKASYGLTPLEYRTKLRLFDAQMLLLLNKFKISTVAYASGFSDHGRFLKQFRQLFRARPSQFKPEQVGSMGPTLSK